MSIRQARTALRHGHTTVRILGAISPYFTLHMADLLLRIALLGGKGVRTVDLADEAEMSQSALSRNLTALSDEHYLRKDGFGLIRMDRDPDDWRRKIITLTSKGEAIISKIEGAKDA